MRAGTGDFRATGASGTARAVATVALLLCCTAELAGCASEPVSMDARIDAAAPAARIGRPIAYVHSPEFRNQQHTIEPYRNRYFMPLKTGEATDKGLRTVYGQLFTTAREVESREEVSRLGGPNAPEALLEPSIVDLKYLNASLRMEGPFHAEITYRFRLIDAGGATIANWLVRGRGHYPSPADRQPRTKDSPPGPRGEEGILTEAPRRAIADAIAGFVRSFDRVPELIRWTRGQPVTDVDVAFEKQVTRGTAPPASGVDASYPGAFTLRVERAPIPTPPKAAVEETSPELKLAAIRITLQNNSTHRLALDPSELEWSAGPEGPLEPIPPSVAAALVTRLPFGLTVATGTGVAALPALIAGLISAGENVRHQGEYAAWSAAVTADTLVDGIANAGDTRSGLVYFPPPQASGGGTLTARVIDLDGSLRYTVRVPLAVR